MSTHDTEPELGPENEYETAPETPRGADDRQRSGFHPVNVGHLVMGLAFLGLAVVWLLVDREVVEVEHHGWVLGLPWLIGGAAGLAASVVGQRRRC